MLKWKPKAPDNVLSSSEVASMFSEIICTSGFLSSLRYLFAHQCHPCLHCDILTDTQTSSKMVLSIYSLPVVLALHYLVCLTGVKGGKEGWMPWLILVCYKAFLLNYQFKCKVSSDWPSLWLVPGTLQSSRNAINSYKIHTSFSRNPVAVWLAAIAQRLGTEQVSATTSFLDKAMVITHVGHVGPQRASS